MRLSTATIALVVISAAGCAKKSTPAVVASYTTLGASEFESLIDTLSWTGGATQNRCTNAACTATVPVRIDASPGSHLIDSVNGGPTEGSWPEWRTTALSPPTCITSSHCPTGIISGS